MIRAKSFLLIRLALSIIMGVAIFLLIPFERYPKRVVVVRDDLQSSAKPFIFCVMVFSLIFSPGIGNAAAQSIVEGIHYLTGEPVRVKIEDGSIAETRAIRKLSDEFSGLYIAPGLIDIQVNGYAGVSFSFGGGDLTQEGVVEAMRGLWKTGVTTCLPTLTTNRRELLAGNLAILARAADDEEMLGSIPGFHLEGPYINPEDGYRGAHPRQFVRLPDWDEFMVLHEASGEHVLMVTVAPELEGAQEFIRKCRDKGIVVGVGHHNANREQLDLAVQNGARIATHLGNGCANLINRHYNPLWPQLANNDLMISMICDGFHLLPEEIRVFYQVKGADKAILISDITSYAGLEPGEYKTLTGETIELTADGMLRYPAQDVLYGSASPLSKGVGHIMKVTGCSLADAIRMAATNPASLLGLSDRGTLEPGQRADLILFTLDDHDITIHKTYVRGEMVYDRGPVASDE